jgi:Na+-transporting methylmalonyl-CoA/oxaloacetate decarboxylase gamma subunit
LNTFVEGLIVSAIGIVTIFIAAGIFYLVIVLLLKIFPPKAEEEEEEEATAGETQEEAPVAAAVVSDSSDELSTAAAIAVAVFSARARSQSSLGQSLQEGHSSWWSAHLLSARNNPGSNK